MRKTAVLFLAAVLAAGAGIFSCGIEEYQYLPALKEAGGSITRSLSDTATIRLPSLNSSEFYYFRYFYIYYRIYISGYNTSAEINNDTEMKNIHDTLLSDYNAIFPSSEDNVTNSSTANTAIGSLFSGRRYYQLALEDADINSVLSDSAMGRTLAINFPPNTGLEYTPTLTINGGATKYNLFRSTNEGSFTPDPDRLFFNTQEICTNESAYPKDSTKNADVVGKEGIPATPRYTWVSLYIVLAGFQQPSYTLIYSKPTWVGVFKLPNKTNW